MPAAQIRNVCLNIAQIVIPNIALALEETEMPKPVNSEKKVSSLLLVDDVDMNLRVMTALCKKVGVEKIITAKFCNDDFLFILFH